MKNIIFVMTLVAFALAPRAFTDEIEGGGTLQRVEEPEGEQSAQEAASTDEPGTGDESDAIGEPVSDNADTSPVEV